MNTSTKENEAELALIGCYTQSVPHEPDANGPGVIGVRVFEKSIELIKTNGPEVVGPNPSYMTRLNDDEIVVVNEVPEWDKGIITQLRHDGNGILSRISTAECGKAAAHVVEVDNGVVASCFGDGSLWSYTHDEEGHLRVADIIYPCKDYTRKDGPTGLHMALVLEMDQTGLSSSLMMICDPKADMLTLVRRSVEGIMESLDCFATPMDGYPRHAVCEKRKEGTDAVTYVALAKKREIMKVIVENGKMKEEWIRTLPVCENGKSGVLGGIRIVEKEEKRYVLVSERGNGADGIWRVSIDKDNIEEVKWITSHGEVPRDFDIGKKQLLVANQSSGDFGIIERERIVNGEWNNEKIYRCRLGGNNWAPVCILFMG